MGPGNPLIGRTRLRLVARVSASKRAEYFGNAVYISPIYEHATPARRPAHGRPELPHGLGPHLISRNYNYKR